LPSLQDSRVGTLFIYKKPFHIQSEFYLNQL